MSYLTPFSLILQPKENPLYRRLILTDEPGIPDDTYALEEWYCPNPLCPCNEVHLKVYALQQKTYAVNIRLPLDPQQPISPILDNEADDTFPVYTAKLFRLIAEYLKNNPDDVQRLRQRFQQFRAVAGDPSHPCYKAVSYWGKHGYPQRSASSGHKRHK